MTRTLLLFDIDGTLLKTAGAGMRAMDHVARKLFGNAFHWEGISAGGRLDPHIFADALQLNGLPDESDHHETFHQHYIPALAAEIESVADRVEVLPGMHELVTMLRDRQRAADDVALGMVTGNYAAAAPLKLRAAGYDPSWFEVGAYGDDAADRPGLVSLAMRRYHERYGATVNPNDVIVIGDTPHDVDCALANGCRVLAVCTGSAPREALKEAGATMVVDDLADPTPLLRMIDGDEPAK